MDRRRSLAVGAAVAGFLAVLVGIFQGLVHVAPAYEGTITTGWDGALNHEELLLAQLGAFGVVGAVASLRWRHLAVAPLFVGGVVTFYTVRAVLHYARNPGLYTEVTTHSGGAVRYVLGAEPFLLGGGGLLFVAAALGGWRSHRGQTGDADPATDRSTTA